MNKFWALSNRHGSKRVREARCTAHVDRPLREARAVALDGIGRAPAEATLKTARLQHLLGHIEFRTYDRAPQTMPSKRPRNYLDHVGWTTTKKVDIWLAVQVQKAHVAVEVDEVKAGSICATIRPLVEAEPRPMVVAGFYSFLSAQHARAAPPGRRGPPRRTPAGGPAAQAVEGTEWDLFQPETYRFRHNVGPR